MIKLRAGDYMVPASLLYEDKRIYVKFPYNKRLIAEIKNMDRPRWHGFDTPPRKVWSIADSPHNAFQLAYLQGQNPYAPYDAKIIEHMYDRPLYAHQKSMSDFMLTIRQCIVAGEMGCIDGEAIVHCNRAKRGFNIPIEELFYKFHNSVHFGNKIGQKGWNSVIPTYIRSLCDGELRLNLITNVLYKGIKSVVKLTLKSGKNLRLTPDHEVCVGLDKFQAVETLKVGDIVLTNGTWIDKDGYIRVGGLKNKHPRWTTGGVYEHILIMEEYLGRHLESNECVHHINGIREDNRIENLQLTTYSEHAQLHGKQKGYQRLRGYFLPKEDTIISIEDVGKIAVYDIVCADPSRNFVANKIIVHNCGKSLSAIETMERSGTLDWWWVAPRSGIRAVNLELKIWGAKFHPRMMTYAGLTKEMKNWRDGRKTPKGVFFDESSKAKNPTAQRSQAAMALANGIRADWGREGYIILMSGSPAPRAPVDWFWQCEIACPGFLKEGTHAKFKQRLGIVVEHESITGGVYPHLETWLDDEHKCAICGELELSHFDADHDFKSSKNEISYLYERMKGLVVVHLKKDCLDLPDKQYQIIELKPTQKIINVAKSIVSTASTVISGITLLRELSDGFQYKEEADGVVVCPVCRGKKTMIDPLDPDSTINCDGCGGLGEKKKYKRVTQQVETPKEEALRDILDTHTDIGRLVIFAGFTGSIDRCVSICEDCQWETIRVDGRGWQSAFKEPLEVFQKDFEGHPRVAFIGQPGAGGMGLTLTASPTTVYYSNDFNAESRIQSEDRIHRIGMDNNRGATIIDLVHLATDQLILDNLKKKRKLQSLSLGELQRAFA